MIVLLSIDLVGRTVTAYDQNKQKVIHPFSASGGSEIKFTKSSPGGLIIQALVRMIENRDGRV